MPPHLQEAEPVRLHIWKVGNATNGNPIFQWETGGLNAQRPRTIPDAARSFWLNPDERARWAEMYLVDRSEFIALLYESGDDS